jgi:parallel beta-helix repeat protein
MKAILTILVFFIFCSNSWATIYYVDGNLTSDCKSGNYNKAKRNCSGSDGNAFNTIQEACNVVSAGDFVYVRGGIYNDDVDLTTSGTASQRIVFQAYSGENPVVDGSGIHDNKLVRIGGSYIIWDGIDVRDGANKGLYMHGNYGIVRNIETYNNGHSGIFIDVCHNVLVEYNKAHDNGWNGIDVMESNNVTVRYNTAYNQRNHMGIQAVSNHLKLWPTGNLIYNNEVYNNINGIYWAHNRNGKIYNNVIYKNRDNGISFNYMTPVGPVTYNAYVKIYNNTIVDNKNGIANPLANYLTINNNILAYNTSNDIRMHKTTGHDIDYNLYLTTSSFRWGSSSYNSISSWRSASRQDANSLEGNPDFVNRSGNDYRIGPNSDAINQGISIDGITGDLIGTSRPQQNRFDIGCYEASLAKDNSLLAPHNLTVVVK